MGLFPRNLLHRLPYLCSISFCRWRYVSNLSSFEFPGRSDRQIPSWVCTISFVPSSSEQTFERPRQPIGSDRDWPHVVLAKSCALGLIYLLQILSRARGRDSPQYLVDRVGYLGRWREKRDGLSNSAKHPQMEQGSSRIARTNLREKANCFPCALVNIIDHTLACFRP
ncbi:hypothetical protein BDZ97DRAFT_268052 [Flammula alnicola]|nr:hypothetical protein BDZ97DRAFT_268052 [Flammula alnicola]